MAAGVVLTPQSNAFSLPEGPTPSVEYEKILRLRDDVFAGTHPRLKLSSQLSSKVTAASYHSPPRVISKISDSIAATSKLSQNQESAYSSPKPHPPASTNLHSTSTSTKPFTSQPLSTAANGSSGLDPIFSTQSDDPVGAEMRLERQRIERSLEDQMQQKRMGTRQRLLDQEALPDFDVAEVLFQAQELVKPLTAAEHNTPTGIPSSTDSFDDNTFYSSQVNESTTDEADEYAANKKRGTKPCRFFFEGLCRKGDACTYSHDPAFKRQLRAGQLTVELDSLEPDHDVHPSLAHRQPKAFATGGRDRRASPDDDPVEGIRDSRNSQLYGRDEGRQREEARNYDARASVGADEVVDLSPARGYVPAAQAQHPQSALHLAKSYGRTGEESPTAYSPPDAVPRRNGPSSPLQRDGKIVRSHITSPVAPQPARVSPLAVAKVPRVDQVRREHDLHSPGYSRLPSSSQQSPASAIQPANSRKRRREPDLNEAGRNVTARRYMDSPGPYIKEEPITPPPFAEIPTHRYSRYEHGDRQPAILAPRSPQQRERVVYQPVHDQQYLDRREIRHVSTPVVRRVVSRPGQHYEVQDEPDLRRVISTKHTRRGFTPPHDAGHYPAPQARPTRAMSHAYVVQPEAERPPPYRGGSVQPPPQIISRSERPHSPNIRRVQYAPVERETTVMAPPPRRIVMDQYGNQYYEAVVPPERKAPLAMVPPYATEPVNPFDRASRRASVRPEFARVYSDSYSQRIASPGPASPRYIEYRTNAEPLRAASRQPIYEARDPLPARNEAIRVIEYPSGGRYEEVPRAREPVMRMQSVRPSTSYARPPEYVESSRRQYEYLPSARPRGYVEEDMEREVVMEAPRSGGRRAYQ